MYNIVVTVALLLLAMISTLLGVASTEINEIFVKGSHSFNIFIFSKILRQISKIVPEWFLWTYYAKAHYE